MLKSTFQPSAFKLHSNEYLMLIVEWKAILAESVCIQALSVCSGNIGRTKNTRKIFTIFIYIVFQIQCN